MANEFLLSEKFAVEASQPGHLVFVREGVEGSIARHLAAKIGILVQNICLQEVRLLWSRLI